MDTFMYWYGVIFEWILLGLIFGSMFGMAIAFFIFHTKQFFIRILKIILSMKATQHHLQKSL